MHDIKPSHPRSKHHIMHYLHRCACYKYVVGIYFLHNGMQHAQSGAEFCIGEVEPRIEVQFARIEKPYPRIE